MNNSNKTLLAAAGTLLVVAVVAIALGNRSANRVAESPVVPSNPAVRSQVAVTSVTGPNGANLAAVGATAERTIRWQTNGYPSNVGVNVNLIRKTSDSPISWELVRQLATNTQNDGEFSWTPKPGETGSDLYIQVTCTDQKAAPNCAVGGDPIAAF